MPGVHADPARYRLAVDSSLTTLTVQACFPAPPRALHADEDNAGAALKRAVVMGGTPARVQWSGQRMEIPASKSALCIEYDVDTKAARPARYLRDSEEARNWVLLRAGSLLWLPRPLPETGVTLDVQRASGIDFSVPWPLVSESAETATYDLSVSPAAWPALIALGRMQQQTVVVPGAALRFALLDAIPAPDPRKLEGWVRQGAEAVAAAYGKFPVAAPQVLIVPVGAMDEAVPWGQVLRGGGPAAHLFVDQTRSAAELRDDWVLVHELSHMLHPNLHGDGIWLAEGFATYYQNVLRARSGALGEEQAWLKLHEGFERGRQQTRPGVNVEDAQRHMLRERMFMRVYWTGAALALETDLALRKRGRSLDEALSLFNGCCGSAARMWPAREFLARLDELTGGTEMQELYDLLVVSDRFPDLEPAWHSLGLEFSGGTLRFSADERARTLRAAIMAPREPRDRATGLNSGGAGR